MIAFAHRKGRPFGFPKLISGRWEGRRAGGIFVPFGPGRALLWLPGIKRRPGGKP